jgi:tetratricopeptide (TPR) repeat protein
MRRVLPLALALAVFVFGDARAQPSDTPPAPAPAPEAIDELTLDQLFEQLAEDGESPAGARAEEEILTRFNRSGSDTSDLLLGWAAQAIEDKDYPLALDVLDQIVVLKPDFAEAWNRRATVYYLIDDYSSALGDIRQVLALEPRHFGALSGLGLILESMDRREEAIEVFRRTLEINPRLEKVRESLERLEKETAGDSI